MDDFEYSVHISDQDWDCFFQECEGCNLLSPVLASREDSGMSDIDEMGCHFMNRTPATGTASTEPDPDLQIDEPPDSEGSPVGNYLSKYGIRSPEQILSGSEEDLHLQTVNLFFEQLKSVTEKQQPLEQSHVVNRGSEETGHLVGLIDKQEILSVAAGPSGLNKDRLMGEMAKQGVANTWGDKASDKVVKPKYTKAQEDASKSDSELVISRKSLTTPLITVRMKQEQQRRFCNLGKDLQLKPEAKPSDKEKVVVVNRKDMTNPYTARENFAYLDTISSSDSKDSPMCQIPVSPSRRKKRKKKRMNVEALEPGYESQIHVCQSESEDDKFSQREEMNNLPANVWKTEHFKSLIKTPSIAPTDHLQLRNIPELEASADFQYSKSLPVSFTNNLGTTPPKSDVGCFHSIIKDKLDVSLVNNEQLKAEISGLSLLPQIEKILNLQESTLNTPESFQFDPALQFKESKTGIRETLSEPLRDNSDTGCQRKSLLSPNISSTVDSTGSYASAVSFKLPENKDLSCLGNETICSVFKNEETTPSKRDMAEISDIIENSLNSVGFCSDGYNPKPFICSQEAPQNLKKCPQVNISESQSQPANQNDEINMNISERETKAMAVSHIPNNTDHEEDEAHVQSGNKTSEVQGSPIMPGNLDKSGDQSDVSTKNDDEQLFYGKSSGSSEDVSGPMEEMLNEDPTQELPHSSESKSKAKEAEIVSLDASGHLPSPVFAISSFWNEMEKLTINDILRLRVTGNSQHTSVLTQPDDSSIVDTTDAADSGYFTQLDDSKPDRLSGDMSYISDLEEDLAQLQSQFSSKQEDELCDSPNFSGVMWENEPDPVVMGDEIAHLSSETALPEHLYMANAQQCFRRMCKNLSVQNLQALDAEPNRKIQRNASMHSMFSEVEDDPFYHVNASSSKIFSDDEEEVETSGVTFSEIIQYFFGEDEPERCASRADSIAASYLDGTGTSLPENYDHFFSEFDSGSFVYPFMEESGGNKMVPIFSCSRSANRNLQFPEAYDYFFPDSPGNSDEDDENDNAAIKVVTRYDHESPNHEPVDMYEHFYSENESDYFWTSPLSVRQSRRSSFAVPEEKACSGELVPVKRFPKGIIQPINAFGPDGSPFPESFLLNLDSRIFQQLAEQQKKCMEMQPVVTDPRLDAPFLPLKQADMCLVCIAFASWVLKSTGSGGDTWKAALLANISALSAIGYLRRHKREEVSGKTPLRQIKPA